jgi:2-methylcitrate dehydratase PrpD
VIGGGTTASLYGATVINGYLATAITACDVYVPAHCHMTPSVVPPALAVAEQIGASGEELLTAIAVGLEVTARVAASIDFGAFRRRGWHSPGIVGAMGAAAAVARLLGLDVDGTRRSLSLAYSQAGGTAASWPTPAVKFHQARGAGSGLMSGYLAAQGFEAAQDVLHDRDGGLYSSYAPGDPALVVADLGRHWELENISLRLWSGATTVQSLLTVMLADAGALPAPDSLQKMVIRVPAAAYSAHSGVSKPTGTFEALLSFHHIAAVILLRRDFDITLAGEPWLSDPQVRSLVDNRIVLRPDDDVPLGGVAIDFELTNGEKLALRQHVALGAPANPASRQQVDRKFLMNANTRPLGLEPSSLLTQLRSLRDVADCREVTVDIRGAGAAQPTIQHSRLGSVQDA